MTQEAWFHLIQIAVEALFGSGLLWAVVKMYVILKEFGVHRHQEQTGTLHAEGVVKARSLNGE